MKKIQLFAIQIIILISVLWKIKSTKIRLDKNQIGI